jgi:hypothetical protein
VPLPCPAAIAAIASDGSWPYLQRPPHRRPQVDPLSQQEPTARLTSHLCLTSSALGQRQSFKSLQHHLPGRSYFELAVTPALAPQSRYRCDISHSACRSFGNSIPSPTRTFKTTLSRPKIHWALRSPIRYLNAITYSLSRRPSATKPHTKSGHLPSSSLRPSDSFALRSVVWDTRWDTSSLSCDLGRYLQLVQGSSRAQR